MPAPLTCYEPAHENPPPTKPPHPHPPPISHTSRIPLTWLDDRWIRCTEGNWSASTKANFAAGRWHHDRCGRLKTPQGMPITLLAQLLTYLPSVPTTHLRRCGRRLKAFIYLSNVSAGSHPTQIAWPTHNTQYYTHHIKYFTLSRFADAHVRKNHRVASMAGPFGGGFLMDTNAIHKIECAAHGVHIRGRIY